MNFQDIIHEEYDTDLKAQKVSLVSAATIYAIVSADIVIGDTIGINSNVTLNPSKNYVGLTTTTLGIGTQKIGLVTLNPSDAYIGLTTSTISNATLYAVVNTAAVGNTNALATLLSGPNQIGSVTVSNIVPVSFGNITLSDAKTFIGLVTADIAHAWANPNAFIGLTTSVNATGTSFIGLVTATLGNDYGSGTIFTGMASGASGVVRQLGANAATWCIVKADSSNATTVFLGPSLASVNTAFPLEPGEATGFSISNTNLLYLCATGTFSTVRFTGGL